MWSTETARSAVFNNLSAGCQTLSSPLRAVCRSAHFLLKFLMNWSEPMTSDSTAVQMASDPPTSTYSAVSSSTLPSARSATVNSAFCACAGIEARRGAVAASPTGTALETRFVAFTTGLALLVSREGDTLGSATWRRSRYGHVRTRRHARVRRLRGTHVAPFPEKGIVDVG